MFWNKEKKLERQRQERGRKLVGAAKAGNTADITRLLAEGADVEFRDSNGVSPLFQAASSGQLAAVTLLLDRGAAIDGRAGKYGGTPLMTAALAGHLPALQLLLDRGAQINAIDNDGDTALACAVIRERTALVTELLKRGANTEITNNKGQAPVEQVKGGGAILLALTGQAAPVSAPLAAAARPAALPPNPDEVVFLRDFGGGRVLQEIFNFPAHERISVVRHGAEGAVEAMTRDSFEAIGDKAGLRKAFAEYAARGGTVPEAEVFPEALDKPKPAVRGL